MSDQPTKSCPYCGETILASAIKCKHCGSDLTKPGSVNAAKEQPKKSRKGCIIGVVALLLVLCLVGAVAALSGGDKDQNTASTGGTKSDSQTKPTATPAQPAPPFEEIRSKVASMTEAQWKAYLPTLKGLLVENWAGWVVDVNKTGNSYELWIDMDPPETILSTQDIYFPIPNDIALELQKGEKVTFSGTIKLATELLGSVTLHLEDVTLQREK